MSEDKVNIKTITLKVREYLDKEVEFPFYLITAVEPIDTGWRAEIQSLQAIFEILLDQNGKILKYKMVR